MIKESNCTICGKYFRRRYSRKQKEPKCCSVACFNKRLKTQLWADSDYRKKLSDAHKGHPGYWTGKQRLDMRGNNSPSWKGGHKYIDEQGYVRVGLSKHENNGKKGYIKEHRLVMENHLGRKLKSNEVVHHINGKRDDNKIENLELFNQGKHISLHHKGKKVSDLTRKKLSKAHKGKKLTKEHRRKISEGYKRKYGNGKKLRK